MVFSYISVRFIINDNSGSDLAVILYLSFLITMKVGYTHGSLITSLIAVSLLFFTYFVVRRNLEHYPE